MLDNWQSIAKQLAEQYSVYILDQRNHGRSPRSDDFDYSLLAEDLQEFMESHWIYEAIVIGHSMGGKAAMQFALSYPEMVHKLVVVDMAPKVYPAGHQLIFDALFSLDIATIKSRKEAAEVLQQKIQDKGTIQFLLKNLSRKKEGGFDWKMNLPVLHQQYAHILENVQLDDTPFERPTLFIRGGQSDYIVDSDKASIATFFPAATIATIPAANHWVHATAPMAFLQEVRAFLED